MSTRIGREEALRFAQLARIRLSDAEADALARDLDAILGYVAELEALDTEGVEPTSCVLPRETPMRADEPVPSLDPEAVLGRAPLRAGTSFAVPRVLEDEEEA